MHRMVHYVQMRPAPDIELTYMICTLETLKTMYKKYFFAENIGFIGHFLKI